MLYLIKSLIDDSISGKKYVVSKKIFHIIISPIIILLFDKAESSSVVLNIVLNCDIIHIV